MSRALPPITWFRAFDAAVRHLSFTRAGEELGVTQSAISQHVRALEERLGAPLFLRGHRSLQLTDAGRLLVGDVASAMGRLQRATDRFQPAMAGAKLTVATSVSIAQWVLAPRLAGFLEANRDIAIQIATTIWPDDFSATRADVEIRFGAGDVVGRDADLLEPSILHAVAAPALLDRLGRAPDWRDLASMTLIQPVGLSVGWSDLAHAAGAPSPVDPQLLVDTHGLAVELAVAGAGVALTHGLISRAALTDGRLRALPLDAIPAEEGYYLARRETGFPDAQARFLDWFGAVLEEA